MSKRRVCFVSFELSPFTGGGIGTWLANTLNAYENTDAEFTVLFCATKIPEVEDFKNEYPNCNLFGINPDAKNKDLTENTQIEKSDFSSYSQWRSFLIMRKLKLLEQEGTIFDIIEFVDWCGTAFHSINEKRLGNCFQNTLLAIRLHATESVLRKYETRGWNSDNISIYDLERQALQNADIKIAHLSTTADIFKEHFKFSQNWRDEFYIELPPVSTEKPSKTTTNIDNETPIVFTSKFQSIKRPYLFARGVAEFIESSNSYNGKVKYLAFDVDGELKNLSESAFIDKNRIEYLGLVKRSERDEIISKSIAIFPGIFEAFCFAAYEASMVGAITILNNKNPAFGDNTPWVDGKNCLKFDGTISGLTKLLHNVFEKPTLTKDLCPISIQHEPKPYWEKVEIVKATKRESYKSVSLIVINKGLGPSLFDTVEQLLNIIDDKTELIIANQYSDDDVNNSIIENIEKYATQHNKSIRIVHHNAYVGTGALLNLGLNEAKNDIVGFVNAGYIPERNFLYEIKNAFSDGNDVDVLLPIIGILDNKYGSSHHEVKIPIGAAVNCGLFLNNMSALSLFAKRELLLRYQFDENLRSEWSWDLLLRAAFDGANFAISSDVIFSCSPTIYFDSISTNETVRRETIECIRSRYRVTGNDAAFNLSNLGDGELYSYMYHFNGVIENGAVFNTGNFDKLEKLLFETRTDATTSREILADIAISLNDTCFSDRDFITKRSDDFELHEFFEIKQAVNNVLDELHQYRKSRVLKAVNFIGNFTGINAVKRLLKKS